MSKENNLLNTKKKALNETTNILKDLLKNNLIKVVLYGSYARGDLKYNITINPLIENTDTYNEYKKSSSLFENIEKEGVVLYGI